MPSGAKDARVKSERYVNVRILLAKFPSAATFTSSTTDALDGGNSDTISAEL